MPWNRYFNNDDLSNSLEGMKNVTDAVQLQYELFPYPRSPIETPADGEGFLPLQSYILGQYSRCYQLQYPMGKRALSAGCGTGREIHTLSVLNPKMEIIGFDLSETSLAIAQQRIDYHHLSNCRVQLGNLLDVNTLPEGLFDFILCYGVLHHTANIQVALHNLSQKLHPQGVMGLMLYNRSGRRGLYQLREALELLGIYELPIDAGMQFVRQLLNHSVPGSYLHLYAKTHEFYYQFDENLVDNCFHPMDRAYDIHEIPELLNTCHLTLLDVAPFRRYWMPQYIIDPSFHVFYERYESLSLVTRLHILELLNPEWETQNLFWCCHSSSQIPRPDFTVEKFQVTQWQLNPLFIQHAQIQFPFSTVGQNLLSRPTNPDTQVTIKWPYFQNEYRSGKIMISDLQDFLFPLAERPTLGSEILNQISFENQTTVLRKFEFWEDLRIVLRAT